MFGKNKTKIKKIKATTIADFLSTVLIILLLIVILTAFFTFIPFIIQRFVIFSTKAQLINFISNLNAFGATFCEANLEYSFSKEFNIKVNDFLIEISKEKEKESDYTLIRYNDINIFGEKNLKIERKNIENPTFIITKK